MAISDPWDKTPDEATFGRSGAPITPSDSDMAEVSKGLFVTGEGDLTFIAVDSGDSDAITLTVTVGMIIPYFIRRVTAATTATVCSMK